MDLTILANLAISGIAGGAVSWAFHVTAERHLRGYAEQLREKVEKSIKSHESSARLKADIELRIFEADFRIAQEVRSRLNAAGFAFLAYVTADSPTEEASKFEAAMKAVGEATAAAAAVDPEFREAPRAYAEACSTRLRDLLVFRRVVTQVASDGDPAGMLADAPKMNTMHGIAHADALERANVACDQWMQKLRKRARRAAES
jgi:hypothetical protein